MSVDRAINLLVTVTLIEMMMAAGLGVPWRELMRVVGDWRLVTNAALASYVCVPAAAAGLLIFFQAQSMTALGFLIVAVCPGAPFGPPLTALAKGDVPASVGLMSVLAAPSALVSPLLLHLLMPIIAGNEAPPVDPVRLISTLVITQLAPLCLGLAVRHWQPAMAQRLQRPADRTSLFLVLISIGSILAIRYPVLATVRLRGITAMALLFIVSLAAGWLLGGRRHKVRKALTLTTALRNIGVALVIATGAFPGTAAVTAVLGYGLFGIVGSVILAAWWRRAN